MALDPSIILRAGGQQQQRRNPLRDYANVMAIQGVQKQNALADEQAQREAALDADLSSLPPGPDGAPDLKAARGVFWRHGFRDEALKIDGMLSKREAEASKPPTMRKLERGDTVVQQEWDPASRTFVDVSTAPRWNPKAGEGPGIPKYSARSEILPSGAIVAIATDGSIRVTDPEGNALKGEARVKALQEARDLEAAQARRTSQARASGTASVEASSKVIDQIGAISRGTSALRDAISAIDAGANTGPLMSKLPSLKQSTLRLEQAQRELGLNVIQETTFGALSEGEMQLALQTGIPTNLKPDELKQWALKKLDAQEKLQGYLTDYAIFLGQGGTKTEWLEAMRGQGKTSEGKPLPQPATSGEAQPIPTNEQGIPMPRTAQEAMNLPPGTVFIAPDGTRKVRP